MVNNPHQDDVINNINGIFVVDAGPGTGKTYTITKRYMNILKSDGSVSINDILLLTFTDNAAENMKEKIINSITKKHADINILDAKISTFHSFCNNILKRNPENAPKYLGIEETLSKKYDILENGILEQIRFKRIYYAFRKNNITKYERLFKTLEPNDVLNIIKKLLSKGIFPKKEGWFLDGEEKLMGNFEEFIKLANEINTPKQGKKGLTQSKLLKSMKDKLRNKHYLDFPEDCFLKKQVNPEYLKIAFNEDREDLISFIHDIYYEYIRQSVIENKLTFDFLIMFVFLLLYHDHELRKRNSFKYVMVDEFQDTNEMQFMLTLLFMETNNLCVVGDWKQGIYGFRHATIDNILNFKEKLKEYKTLLNKDYPRINFDVGCCDKEFVINFRSSQKILDFAKKALIVKGSKSEEVNIEEINKKIVELKANYKLDEYSDIKFFKAKNGDNGRENEIKLILSKVQEIVNNEDYKIIEFNGDNAPKYRNIEYKDIAILSRSRNFCLELQEKALEIGIPINYDGGVELFKTDEALLLLAWLRLLLNKYDTNAWITLLEYKNYNYLEKKEILENIKNNIMPEKLLNYRNYLLKYQNNIIALISKIYELYEINTKHSNAIVSEIGKIFNNNPLSLQNLVYFIEENIKNGRTYEISINTTDNAVNLQTIHGSKGLEYPIVFVVNCNNGQFPSNNSDKNIIEYNDICGIRAYKLYGVKNNYYNIFDNWKADLLTYSHD